MTIDNFVFRCTLGALFLMCLFVFGCGNHVKVKGTVTYSDIGEPVKFGMVVFNGEKLVGRGAIKDGKYSVGRIIDGDGIPRGTYTISSDSPYIPPPPQIAMIGMDGKPVQRRTQSQDREIYHTKEPQTLEIKKSMTYDFTVERGSPERSNPQRR